MDLPVSSPLEETPQKDVCAEPTASNVETPSEVSESSQDQIETTPATPKDEEMAEINTPRPEAPVSASVEDAVSPSEEVVAAVSKEEVPAEEEEFKDDAQPQEETEGEENKMDLVELSASELVDKLALLIQDGILPKRVVVEAYKTAFYRKKKRVDEADEVDESILEEKAQLDAQEDRLKDLLTSFRELNQKRIEQLERDKAENLEKKKTLLGKLRELLTSQEEFGKINPVFREIREEWRQIGIIPEPVSAEIQREYSTLVEQFYDLKQINDEFREYDFRKNLEAKTALCEEAEKLVDMPDVIQAFRLLQGLHDQWRELGPVARDLRESVWARFKAASTAINKRHQGHFDKQKESEKENLNRKTAICQEMESIDVDKLTTSKQWSETTSRVLALQAQWKEVGFAPRSANEQLYKRFRASCDAYFSAKSNYFSRLRQDAELNLQRKREIVEEAESLQESTEWRKTADRLIQLQKEWKEIGPVSRKYNEVIWKRFRGACDHFFERRKKVNSEVYAKEKENLKNKKAVIASLTALLDEPVEVVRDKMDELVDEFRRIGHVAYREKEAVYQAFRSAQDALYEKFDIARQRRRLKDFKKNVNEAAADGMGRLYSERDKMIRALDRMRQELQTYTNNLSFFSVSSKSKAADRLLADIEKKQQRLTDEISLLEEKIVLLGHRIEGKDFPEEDEASEVAANPVAEESAEEPKEEPAVPEVIVEPEEPKEEPAAPEAIVEPEEPETEIEATEPVAETSDPKIEDPQEKSED